MSISSSHRLAATGAAGRRSGRRPSLIHGSPSRRRIGRALGAERTLQIALGVIWLLDGALQLQPFMFTQSFVTQIIAPNTIGQPGFVAGPIKLIEHLIEPRVALFNVFAATIQILIGVGLLYRPTVRAALLTSFAWAFGVWWIGEVLGGLFTGTASPLTGAPGAALLYILAGLIAWPRAHSHTRRNTARGALAEWGALGAWAFLWLGSAALWLLPANRSADAVHDQIANAPSGASWLSSIHSSLTAATAGHGLVIAIAAAGLSAAIGLTALLDRWTRPFVALSVVIALIYFVIGQGICGILTGSGTDPGTGPLLILLAIAIYTLRQSRLPSGSGIRPRDASSRRLRGTGSNLRRTAHPTRIADAAVQARAVTLHPPGT